MMWLCDKGGKCFEPDRDCEHKVYFDTHNLLFASIDEIIDATGDGKGEGE